MTNFRFFCGYKNFFLKNVQKSYFYLKSVQNVIFLDFPPTFFVKKYSLCLNVIVLSVEMDKIFKKKKKKNHAKKTFFDTGLYGDTFLLNSISEIGLCSDLSLAKLGLEPKLYDPGTFGGFGKHIT